jgi:tetratricopeptide (TPR) repeat protein
MNGSPFVLGLTLGVLTTVVTAWSLGSDGPPPAGTAYAESRGDAGPGAADGERAKIARLEAELEALRGTSRREDIEADGPEGEPELPLPPYAPLLHNERLEHLIREVEEQIRSGVFQTCYAEHPSNLAHLVIDRWMTAEQPGRALLLLEQLDDPELMSYGNWIGSNLMDSGDRTGAARAFILGLQNDPSDWTAVAALADLDPALALSFRASANLGMEQREEAAFRAQTALLMLAQGQTESAQATLTELTKGGAMPIEIWDSLIKLDPTFAAGQLESMRGEGAFQENNMGFLLADALTQAGRGAEARQTLQAMLEREDLEWSVLEKMADLETDGGVALLRERTQNKPSSTSFQLLAQRLLAREDREGAIQALLQAQALEPERNGGATRQLIQLDVLRFGPEVAVSARSARDDELLGDIADSYWQAGMRDQAIHLWQSAHDFDPSDGEWREKLRAARDGEDPLR